MFQVLQMHLDCRAARPRRLGPAGELAGAQRPAAAAVAAGGKIIAISRSTEPSQSLAA